MNNVELDAHGVGCGWVVKGPYTTCTKYCRTFSSVLKTLYSMSRTYYYHLPYMLLQARMCNKRECKILCLNGEPQYVVKCAVLGSSISVEPHNEAFTFAAHAVDLLRSRLSFALTSGVVRVDLFKNRAGYFVVNEFESLDAADYPSTKGGCDDESKVSFWLGTYYTNILNELVECVC